MKHKKKRPRITFTEEIEDIKAISSSVKHKVKPSAKASLITNKVKKEKKGLLLSEARHKQILENLGLVKNKKDLEVKKIYHELLKQDSEIAKTYRINILKTYYFLKYTDHQISLLFGVSHLEAQQWRTAYREEAIDEYVQKDINKFLEEVFSSSNQQLATLAEIVERNKGKQTAQGDRITMSACRNMSYIHKELISSLKELGWNSENQFIKPVPEDTSKYSLEIVQKVFLENLNPLKQNPETFFSAMERVFPGITTDHEMAKKYGYEGGEIRFIEDTREAREKQAQLDKEYKEQLEKEKQEKKILEESNTSPQGAVALEETLKATHQVIKNSASKVSNLKNGEFSFEDFIETEEDSKDPDDDFNIFSDEVEEHGYLEDPDL